MKLWMRALIPVLVVGLLLLVVNVAFAAPATPADVTAKACSFSTTTFDWVSRLFFGLSLVLAVIVVILGLRNLSNDGPWGVVVALVGVMIVLLLMGSLTSIAPLAIAAAGGPACP